MEVEVRDADSSDLIISCLSDSELLNSQSLDFCSQFLRETSSAVMKEPWSFEVVPSDSDSKEEDVRVNEARS